MNSRYYFRMKTEERRLAALFIPAKRKASYTVVEKEHARCFHILMHAEVESYFESIVQHTLNGALFSWRFRKKANRHFVEIIKNKQLRLNSEVLPMVLAFNSGAAAIEDLVNVESQGEFQKKINGCFSDLLDGIDDNHGIKGNNLNTLFSPLGYDIETKFPSLIVKVNAFGGKRGNFAHHSATLIKMDKIDPFLVRKETLELIDEIEPFDQDISGLW